MSLGRIPEFIPEGAPASLADELVERWGIAPLLACRFLEFIHQVRCRWPAPLVFMIQSGQRDASDQAALDAMGRPAASPILSTHVPVNDLTYTMDWARGRKPRHPDATMYATGLDFDLLGADVEAFRCEISGTLAAAAQHALLRWGGTNDKFGRCGPSDWFHLDLGTKWV